MWSASTTWPGARGSATERSFAILSATASSICYRIDMSTRPYPGPNAIPASRSSRAIGPAFMRLARVAALPMQRRSAATGICFRTWARHYVLPSAAIARRSAAGKAIIAEMVGNVETAPEPPVETSTKLDGLPRLRRHKRSELYAEILHLREPGLSPASNRAPDRHQRENGRALACWG